MHDVSIIIAWRDSGDANRQANLITVLDHLAPLELPIVLAPDGNDSGPFNRSAAYNEGMRLSPSEVYIFHEADMLVDHMDLLSAVVVAAETSRLVVPFTTYRYMSEADSRAIINGSDPYSLEPEWEMTDGASIGAVNIVSAEAMAQVGQWDETLSGHGYDDNAMYYAFEKALGPAGFIDGEATHLWHPMAFAPWERNTAAAKSSNFSDEEVAATLRNRMRVQLYAEARTPERVRELTAGGS